MRMIVVIDKTEAIYKMPNPHFSFKQFTIYQDACAMKVCTDSCLFGAWIAGWLEKVPNETESILDIGTGTGLLSLMLAQKLPHAYVDAIEIEPLCFQQAKANVLQSKWNTQIEVYNADINRFDNPKKYDVIISNPPFYERDLMGSGIEKNIAHHSEALTLRGLMNVIKKLLTERGCFAVLLPFQRADEFENMASEEGYSVIKKAVVKQTSKHSFFRVMFVFSKKKTEATNEEITIKTGDGMYSPAFVSLLKDYYLYL